MSVFVKTREDPREIWWISNIGFRQLSILVSEEIGADSELLTAWQINEAIQGFDLVRIAQNDRRLGIRLAEVIVTVTSSVIQGERELLNMLPQDVASLIARFRELRDLGEKWLASQPPL